MTTLFDIELYHQSEIQGYKSDWDGAFYDPAWDEPDGTTKSEAKAKKFQD